MNDFPFTPRQFEILGVLAKTNGQTDSVNLTPGIDRDELIEHGFIVSSGRKPKAVFRWTPAGRAAWMQLAQSETNDVLNECREHFAKLEPDQTPIDARPLAEHAGVSPRLIRDALAKCKRVSDSTGRTGHQWRYCDAVEALREIDSGKMKGIIWPDSVDELTTKKDSSNFPARK